LLKDAVEANWNTFSSSDPPASDIYFLGAIGNRDYGDIQFSFWPSINVRPTTGVALGRHRIPELAYVSVHIWVRGNSLDEEPAALAKVRNAFEEMVDTKPDSLIPPLTVIIDRGDVAPPEDPNETTWHWIYNVVVKYDLVKLT
jgi:hypothetical protein